MFHVEHFQEIYTHLGFTEFSSRICAFNLYFELMTKWNKVHNISSISGEEDFYFDHLLDSLVLANVITINECSTIFDIGSGSGFPGVVLAIMHPHKDVVLVDSNSKKTSFLTTLVRKLGLTNVKVVTSRFEDYTYPEKEFIIVNKALGLYDEQVLFFSKTKINNFYFMCTKKVINSYSANNLEKLGYGKMLIIKDVYDDLTKYNIKFNDRIIVNVPRGTFCLQE